MSDFGINDMLEMQNALQEKYKDIWKPICPDRGQDQLLWMIGDLMPNGPAAARTATYGGV